MLGYVPQSTVLKADGRPTNEWLQWLLNPKLQTVNLASALGVTSGGTGLSTAPGQDQILIGNGEGYEIATTLPIAALPALEGDVTSDAGTNVTTLKIVNLLPGTYTNATVTVDGEGRVTSASDGSGGDMLSTLVNPEIQVAGAVVLTLSTFHACSGTATDYAVTLPAAAGNASKFIGVRMVPGLTRWVIVTAAGSDLIDGSATRKMWANETAVLMCTGTGWTKVAGKSIPISVTLKRTTAQSIAASTPTNVQLTSLVKDNTSSLAIPCGDLVNGRFLSARSSDYTCSAFTSLQGVTAGIDVYGGVTLNGTAFTDNPNAYSSQAVGSSGNAQISATGIFSAPSGQFVAATIYQQDSASRSTRSVASVLPTLAVTEIVGW